MAHILVTVKSRAAVGDAVNEIKAICKDNLSLTAYSDPRQAKGTFKKMKKDGKDVIFQDGMILERFEDTTKEELAEKLEAEVKMLRRKFGKLMRIGFSKRLIE